MSESVSYEIVSSTGSTPEAQTIDALTVAAKNGLRRIVLGTIPGSEAQLRPWTSVPDGISIAVSQIPLDGILDQRFLRTLAEATHSMSHVESLSPGARSNLRALSVAATASADAGVASPNLLRGLIWLGIAGSDDAARDAEAADFLVLRGVSAPTIRSNAVAYAQRNPVKVAVGSAAVLGGIWYISRKWS